MPHNAEAQEDSDIVHDDDEREEQQGCCSSTDGRDLGEIWRHAQALVASITVATG
eukprot:CAMPEP_0174755096 /NCGR_PEP_ID=MMETSP1094-20130205/106073_1 /TAXON_ID=156173 /ORGANISM="Chrysochromulina brevifilum, Strain UTEX LB 985" /LENGTH=54 /DNA_ID=CAMNT_0015960983 /DNA_START=2237 /DNA_END=2398 /DNA_ORIENTATION=+